MKNSRDAHGQAMVAYFHGENPIEIYGRDDMCIAARCGLSRRPAQQRAERYCALEIISSPVSRGCRENGAQTTC